MDIPGIKWSMAATVFLDTSVMPQGTMLLEWHGVRWRGDMLWSGASGSGSEIQQ